MSATLRKTRNKSKLIGIIAGKVPVFSFFGAEPEGEGEGGTGSSGGQEGEPSGQEGGEGESNEPPPGETDDQRKLRKANSEAKQRRIENDQLRKERDELKAAQEEAERKDKSDLENAQKDLTTATEKLSARDRLLERNLVETAILKNDSWTWHDLDLVTAALDKNEVKVDLDTGTVTGLDDELKRIAKEKEFLVASTKKSKKENSGEGNGQNNGGQQQRGPSGGNIGQSAGQQVNKAQADRDALINKSPALRNKFGRR